MKSAHCSGKDSYACRILPSNRNTLVPLVWVRFIPPRCNWGIGSVNELKLEVNEAAEKPGSESSKLPYHSTSTSMQIHQLGSL